MTEWWQWALFAAVNVPVVFGIGWAVFDSWANFRESVKFVLMPDLVSLFRGELVEDWWNELKFAWFVLACVAVMALEYVVLTRVVL